MEAYLEKQPDIFDELFFSNEQVYTMDGGLFKNIGKTIGKLAKGATNVALAPGTQVLNKVGLDKDGKVFKTGNDNGIDRFFNTVAYVSGSERNKAGIKKIGKVLPPGSDKIIDGARKFASSVPNRTPSNEPQFNSSNNYLFRTHKYKHTLQDCFPVLW